MSQFPKFGPEDPLKKLTSHSLQNSLFAAVSEAAKSPIGRPQINAGGIPFKPDLSTYPGAKLAKILEVGASTSAEEFKGPDGGVDVIRIEFVDAVFYEEVGPQSLTQNDASSRVAFAASPPGQTLTVDNYVWVVNWSNQWWVVVGGSGGGGSSIVMFTITDAEECGSGCVDADVTLIACGLSGVTVGDAIVVQDEAGCFFSVDPLFLLGLSGFATKMEVSSACDPYNTDECNWVVISMCNALGECP